jgi:hypothetical protein
MLGWVVSLGITAIAFIWSFISVLSVHCGFSRNEPVFRGRRINATANDPGELRRCHRDVAGLLSRLHRKSYELQARALKYKTDPAVEWRSWSRAWRQRWQVVDHRCRLSELGGTGKSPVIDKLHHVHRELDRLQHAYDGVIDRYIKHHARRLKRLRGTLRAIRDTIERRKAKAALGSPAGSGAAPAPASGAKP